MKKTKTNREREIERINSIGRGNLASNISKININFVNDTQMTSSGTKLSGLPTREETKISGKSGVTQVGMPKKTLQSTNSTSLLDTMANTTSNTQTLSKGNQFLPNFRQKQHRDAALISMQHQNTSVSPPK